jgi:hypothetical protein
MDSFAAISIIEDNITISSGRASGWSPQLAADYEPSFDASNVFNR